MFHVDAENNQNDRDLLTGMILPSNELESTIKFTVVSEPVNDEDQDCEELGNISLINWLLKEYRICFEYKKYLIFNFQTLNYFIEKVY